MPFIPSHCTSSTLRGGNRSAIIELKVFTEYAGPRCRCRGPPGRVGRSLVANRRFGRACIGNRRRALGGRVGGLRGHGRVLAPKVPTVPYCALPLPSSPSRDK